MKRLSFNKNQKLRSNGQFRAVVSHRISAGIGLLRLYVCPNQLSYPRFGVSIGKNAGPAVIRNRLKRLSREAFRINQHNLPSSCDYVLIICPKMSKKTSSNDRCKMPIGSYNQFEKLFLELVGKAVGKCRRTE